MEPLLLVPPKTVELLLLVPPQVKVPFYLVPQNFLSTNQSRVRVSEGTREMAPYSDWLGEYFEGLDKMAPYPSEGLVKVAPQSLED